MTLSELKRNLSKDQIKLSDEECSCVKILMTRLATIEYEYYSKNIKSFKDGKDIKLPEISSDIEFQEN
jgi:hypothetical protein